MHTFESKFGLTDRVTIDNDYSIVANVIGVAFYPRGCMYQLSWFNNGTLVEAWVDETRLATA